MLVGVTERRRGRVSRLARDESAYAIAEVREFGRRWSSPAKRSLLATWLRDTTRNALLPNTLYLAARVCDNAEALLDLAGDVESCDRMEPVSAVTCLDLLKRPVESPLFNPMIPHNELHLALRRIRQGIHATAGVDGAPAGGARDQH